MQKPLKQPRPHSHFQSSLGPLNYPRGSTVAFQRSTSLSSLLLFHPISFFTSSPCISPLHSLHDPFPHPKLPPSPPTCSSHFPFFWARPLQTRTVYRLYPAISLAVQDEETDIVKIPENTLNIREITMHYSARKQGKMCVCRILNTHTKSFAKLLTHLSKLPSTCAGVSLHTSSYLRPASL